MKLSSRRSAVATRLALILLIFCATPALTPASPQDSLDEQWKTYNAAVLDSAIYRPENVRPLFPLNFEAPGMRATVVTLTNWNYQPGMQPLTRAVWVTSVPEVQNKCRTFKDKDLALRLRQLLGLQPNAAFTHFVIMTVGEHDVFRPALNPIPTTRALCDVQKNNKCGEVFPDWVTEEHMKWITQQMLGSYQILTPPESCCSYPWTRLGYTYDWKLGADKYGASEYVIRPGALVNVISTQDYSTYCKP
jgi:hypothetical protein